MKWKVEGSKPQDRQTAIESQVEHGTLMSAYTLEVSACVLRRVRLFMTPQTVARQVPLPMGFPRHEYWAGLPFPTPGDQTRISSTGRRVLYTEPPGSPSLEVVRYFKVKRQEP